MFADVTNGRKRRRFTFPDDIAEGNNKADPENAEELQKMDARTLIFGGSGIGVGCVFFCLFSFEVLTGSVCDIGLNTPQPY